MSSLEEDGARSRTVPVKYVVVGVLTAIAGLVLIGSAFAVFAGGGVGEAEALRRLERAGCDVQTFPASNGGHIRRLDVAIQYNSRPATNGRHYWNPAVWGLHREPIDERQLVHNLEHGGIAIQWGSVVSDETRAQIRAFYFEDRNAMVLAPRPDLRTHVALTAWVYDAKAPARRGALGAGFVALCPGFDESAFTGFRSAFRYRGPERFPKFILEAGL
jgi:hypothetical protein